MVSVLQIYLSVPGREIYQLYKQEEMEGGYFEEEKEGERGTETEKEEQDNKWDIHQDM